MALIPEFISRHSFFRFIIVGVLNTLIDFLVFFGLYSLAGWHIIPANVVAFMVAVTNSYLLNKYWSFASQKSGEKSARQFGLFAFISVTALLLSTLILVLGEPFFPVLWLKLAAAIVVPLFNYFSYRFLVFRHQTG